MYEKMLDFMFVFFFLFFCCCQIKFLTKKHNFLEFLKIFWNFWKFSEIFEKSILYLKYAAFQISKHGFSKMHSKRKNICQKQTRNPTNLDFKFSGLMSWHGLEKTQYHFYKVLKVLYICDRVLRLRFCKFWVVYICLCNIAQWLCVSFLVEFLFHLCIFYLLFLCRKNTGRLRAQ